MLYLSLKMLAYLLVAAAVGFIVAALIWNPEFAGRIGRQTKRKGRTRRTEPRTHTEPLPVAAAPDQTRIIKRLQKRLADEQRNVQKLKAAADVQSNETSMQAETIRRLETRTRTLEEDNKKQAGNLSEQAQMETQFSQKLDHLNERLKNESARLKQKESALAKASEETIDLQGQVTRARQEHERLTAEHERVQAAGQDRIDKLSLDIQRLTRDLEITNKQNGELRRAVVDKDNRISRLSKDNEQLSGLNQQHERSNAQASNQLSHTKEALAEQQRKAEQLVALRAELATATEQRDEAQKELKKLRTSERALQAQLASMTNDTHESEHSLRAELTLVRKQLDDNSIKFKSLSATHQSLQNQFTKSTQLASKVPALERTVQDLEQEIADRNEKIAGLEDTCEQLRNESSEVSDALSREQTIANRVPKLEHQLQQVKSALDAHEAKQPERDRVRRVAARVPDLEAEITSLQRDMAERNDANAALSTEREALTERVQQLELNLTEVTTELDAERSANQSLRQRDIPKLEKRLAAAEREHKHARSELAESQTLTRDLESNVTTLEHEISRLGQVATADADRHAGEVANLQASLKSALAHGEDLDAKCSLLKSELDTERQRVQVLTGKTAQLDAALVEKSDQYDALSADLRASEKRLDEAHQIIRDQKGRMTDLQTTLDASNAALEDARGTAQRVPGLEDQARSLQTERNHLQQLLNRTLSNLDTATLDAQRLRSTVSVQLTEFDDALTAAGNALSERQNRMNTLESNLEAARAESSRLSKANEQREAKLRHNANTLQRIATERDALQAELTALRNDAADDARRAEEELMQRNDEVKKLREALRVSAAHKQRADKLQTQLTDVAARYEESERALEAANATVRAAEQAATTTAKRHDNRVQELETRNAQLSAMVNDLRAQLEQIPALEDELAAYQHKLDAAAQRAVTLDSELSAVQSETRAQHENNKALIASLESANDEALERYAEAVQRCEALANELAALAQRLQDSETRCETLAREAAEGNERVDKVRTELGHRVADLQRQLRAGATTESQQRARIGELESDIQTAARTNRALTAELEKRQKAAQHRAKPPQPIRAAAIPDDRDDLTVIKGIGKRKSRQLNSLGIFRYAQLAAFTDDHLTWLDAAMGLNGEAKLERWVAQAARLTSRAGHKHG